MQLFAMGGQGCEADYLDAYSAEYFFDHVGLAALRWGARLLAASEGEDFG